MKRVRLLVSMAILVASIAGSFALVPAASAANWCASTYTVKPGDNLYRIGLRYGYTVTALQALNGLPNANIVYAGQVLCVSGGIVPPPQAPASNNYYVVQWGDTLASIAWRYGVNVYQLAAVNGIANPNWIYAGQSLRLPWA